MARMAILEPGERFHAGGLEMNVPMKQDDLVGVLVDLRSARLDYLLFQLPPLTLVFFDNGC